MCCLLPYLYYLNFLPLIFQASPIAIGGRQAVVEEKRSTNSRGKFEFAYMPCLYVYAVRGLKGNEIDSLGYWMSLVSINKCDRGIKSLFIRIHDCESELST